MKKIPLLILFYLIFIIPNFIYTQDVTCQLIVPSVMPSMISKWQRNPSLIRLILTNNTKMTIGNIKLFGKLTDLKKSETPVATFETGPIQDLGAFEKRTLSGMSVINMSKVDIDAEYESRAGATGRIPEGNYKLCIEVRNNPDLPFCDCDNNYVMFLVITPDPVNLILPLDEDSLTYNKFPVFTWTPVTTAGIQPEIVKYKLKIVPVFEGQSLRDAVDKNPIIIDKKLSNTTYQYHPSDPPFALYPTAIGFAWRVEAFNADDGSPATRNDGYSEPRWFYIRKEKLPKPPRGPQEQIDLSIKNWNKYYGINVKAVSWSYEGEIKNEIQRNQILQEMTDPEKAWFPSGNVLKPDSITAWRITDDKSVKEDEISKWRNEVDRKIKVGHHIFRLKWTKARQKFMSICISDDDSLIYDSMLFNIMLVEEHHSCLYVNIKKLSLLSLGKISMCINIECKNGVIIKCLEPKVYLEYMDRGDFHKRITQNSQNCCTVEYCYAFVLGFQRIKTSSDGFSFEVEGSKFLGTHVLQNNKFQSGCCSGN